MTASLTDQVAALRDEVAELRAQNQQIMTDVYGSLSRHAEDVATVLARLGVTELSRTEAIEAARVAGAGHGHLIALEGGRAS